MENIGTLIKDSFRPEGQIKRERFARTVFVAWAFGYGGMLLSLKLLGNSPASSAQGITALILLAAFRLVPMFVCILAMIKRFRDCGLHERAARIYALATATAGFFMGPSSYDFQGLFQFLLLGYPKLNMVFVCMIVFPVFVPSEFWKKNNGNT